MGRDKKELQEDLTQEIIGDTAPEQIKQELLNLSGHAGWQRVRKVLKKKIEDYATEILDTDVKEEELNRLRDRRDLCLYFYNLPEILIKAVEIPGTLPEFNLDPYGNNVDNDGQNSV